MKSYVKQLFSTNEMNVKEQKNIIKDLCRDTNIEKCYIDIISTSTLNLIKEYILNIHSEIPLISYRRMKVIIIACFWISVKFHSDNHNIFGALDFLHILDIDINPDDIIYEEMTILKKLNFNIWKFMKE
jgi:hypothetical protein